jgi:hypothetical protein
MKPNWEDAPDWANYLAMDENGSWYWFEKEPYAKNLNYDYGMWVSKGKANLAFESGFSWDETLEERPNTTED